MIIRKAEKKDLPFFIMLEETCFGSPWSEKTLQDLFSSSYDQIWTAEEDGQIVGYANLRILCGEGEIERVAVAPDRRCRGIGALLMQSMIGAAEADGAEAISLEVRAGNQPAIRLYQKYGFRSEGIRRNYYQNPVEDAMIMWRRTGENEPETEK